MRGTSADTQLTISGPKAALVSVLLQPASADALAEGTIDVSGDSSILTAFGGVLDEFDPSFPIVTP
ncbi:hypothetical protein OVA31_12050 [Gordonia sp. SL306]|nr:hypothetical protein OVA31_12050 [Gordonia sp. SL306]